MTRDRSFLDESADRSRIKAAEDLERRALLTGDANLKMRASYLRELDRLSPTQESRTDTEVDPEGAAAETASHSRSGWIDGAVDVLYAIIFGCVAGGLVYLFFNSN